MSLPLISIIIPTHNRKKMLERLVKSILSGSYKNIEIIIIDDASTDETYEYIRSKYKKNKKIQILRNKKNLHTAASKNRGAAEAKGEFLFFVDDDNVASKNLIANLVEAISQDKTIGEIGPVIYYYKDRNKIFWSDSKLNMFTGKTKISSSLKGLHKPVWNTDEIPNSYMIRTSIFKKNKIKFNEKLGIMYEDSDIAFKIKKLGCTIKIVKKAKIFHDVHLIKNDRTGFYHIMADKKRTYYTARNRLIFYSDYASKMQLLGIIILWNWIFVFYYLNNILFYSGPGKFSLFKRLELAYTYLHGIFDGYMYAFTKI